MRIPAPDSTVWVDGRPTTAREAAVAFRDPSIHSGLGLFETFAVRDRRVVDVDAHVERLSDAARRLRLEVPDRSRLGELVTRAASEIAFPAAWLKLVLTAAGTTYVAHGEFDPSRESESVAAVLLPWRRNPRDPLDGLKTLSYAANNVGGAWARDRGAGEGLWLNTRGHLAEGCISNLFVVRGRKVFTPSTREGILPGVVRSVALVAAGNLGLDVHETRVRVERLRRADEAFLTSSLSGIRPLVALEGEPVGSGRPGKHTRAIAVETARLRGLPAPANLAIPAADTSGRG